MLSDESAALRISEIFRRCSLRTSVHRPGGKWIAKPGGWEVYNRYAATALAQFKAGRIEHVSEYSGLPQPFEHVRLAKATGPGWFAQHAREVGEASLAKALALEQSVSDRSGRDLVSEEACRAF